MLELFIRLLVLFFFCSFVTNNVQQIVPVMTERLLQASSAAGRCYSETMRMWCRLSKHTNITI